MSIGSMNGIRRAFAFNASISAISSMRRASSQSASSASSCAIVSGRGRRSATRRASASRTVRLTEMFAGEPPRPPPRRGEPHRTAHRNVRGRAGGRIAGPAKSLAFGFSELPLGEVRQFEIIEEHIDKLVAAQDEPERVFAVAFTGRGSSSTAFARTRKHVAFDEFLVSGNHHVARAAFAAKARLIHPIEGDADLAAFQDIPDVAVLRGL